MARIPVVNPGSSQLSNPKITTQSPQAMQTQVVGSAKGIEAIGSAVEKSMSQLHAKLDEARNYTETSQAELFTTSKMADLLVKADNDTYTSPDGKVRLKTGKEEDFAPYDEEIRRGREEAAKFFSSKEQEQRFLAEYNKSALITRNQIQKKFMGNMISEGQAVTMEAVDSLVNAYAISNDPNKDKTMPLLIEAKIDEAVAKGFFDAEDGYVLKRNAIKDAKNKSFVSDLNVNPAVAEEKLKTNAYGFDVLQLENAHNIYDAEIEKKKRELERQNIIATNSREDEDIKLFFNNQLTLNRVEDDMNAPEGSPEHITPSFAVSMKKALTSPKTVSAVTDYGTYEDIMNKILDPTTPASTIRKEILDARGDGKLKESDVKSLMFVAQRGRDTSVYEDYLREKGAVVEPKKTIWNTIWGLVKGVATGTFEDSKIIMDRVISRTEKENPDNDDTKALEIANQEIKKKVVEDNPEIAGFDLEGQKMIDAFGNEATVYPDGRIIEEGEE